MGSYPWEVRDWTADDCNYDGYGQYIYKSAVSRTEEENVDVSSEEEETEEEADGETRMATNELDGNNITLSDFYKRKYWIGNN